MVFSQDLLLNLPPTSQHWSAELALNSWYPGLLLLGTSLMVHTATSTVTGENIPSKLSLSNDRKALIMHLKNSLSNEVLRP